MGTKKAGFIVIYEYAEDEGNALAYSYNARRNTDYAEDAEVFAAFEDAARRAGDPGNRRRCVCSYVARVGPRICAEWKVVPRGGSEVFDRCVACYPTAGHPAEGSPAAMGYGHSPTA